MRKLLQSAVVFLLLCIMMQSCGIEARLKHADKKYTIGEYYAAGKLYQSVYANASYQHRQMRAYAAFRQGECNRLDNDPRKAANAYYAAIRSKYGNDTVYLRNAQVMEQLGNYSAAINNYNAFLKSHPADLLAKSGVEGCQQAALEAKLHPKFEVQYAGEFNSRNSSDYCPVFMDTEGDALVFTSTRPGKTTRKPSAITGFLQGDLYISEKNVNNQWEKPRPMEGGFNTDLDEGAASFTQDGRTIYFTRCPVANGQNLGAQIYTATRSAGEWTEPQPITLFKDSTITVAHPAISAHGDTLYFVSDAPGGFGGKDIWMSILQNGKWGTPQNLGDQINTAGNEMFPYVAADGSLYFSSNGHAGLGGLDIYHAIKTANGWKVTHMPPPINSNADDFGITFKYNQQEGFFSSNRGNTKGYDHIWRFDKPVNAYVLTGTVTDNHRQRLGDALVRLIGNDGTNAKIRVKKDGTYRFSLSPNVEYVLLALCRGYLNQANRLSTEKVKESKNYSLNFTLIPIGKPVELENIFYDFGKWTLTKDSETALNALVKILKDNPNITIELDSHTDHVGTAEFNQTLSEKRAQSVVDYLIQAGISADRLTAKGFGFSQPVTVDAALAKKYPFLKEGAILNDAYINTLTPNQQNIANQINRRTEFRVIKTTYGLQ
ncbi:OmpA family protein [Microbacter margulisiae]|uniref:Peptidoglycan-associated lipoprotein n=1 Tax=Microbacter margulisiae TaxID=1350067 RepID=A0A7W5DT30_9PORP|nr:OmpA family protein [Microbacter margulisiae]MBB3188562.1 peptidoglycan-associated lipoprotein [Microbacter margulisiae]